MLNSLPTIKAKACLAFLIDPCESVNWLSAFLDPGKSPTKVGERFHDRSLGPRYQALMLLFQGDNSNPGGGEKSRGNGGWA